MADYLSEAVAVALARETVRGVRPSADWTKMQPDVGGVVGFERACTDVERDIFTVEATQEPGDHVAYVVEPQLTHDMNKDFVDKVMGAVYRCRPAHFGGTGQSKFYPTAAVDGGVGADSFSVPDSGALAAGTLIEVRGMGIAQNNGFFEVAAGSDADSINVPSGALAAEADPPDNATIDVVGLQGDEDDLSITAAGHLQSAGAVNFTTKNIKVGSHIYLPTAAEALAMGDAKFAFANNAWYAEVTAVTAQLVSLRHHSAAFAADAGNGKEVRVFFTSRFYRNWALDDATNYFEETFSAEKTDVKPSVAADTRHTYVMGCGPNVLSVSSPLNNKITATLSLIGMRADEGVLPANRFAGAAGAGNSPANAYAPLATALVDAQNDIDKVRLGNANGLFQDSENKPLKFNEWTYTHTNNITAKGAQGEFGADDLNYGKFNDSTAITAYHSVPSVITAVDTNDPVWWDVFVKNHQFGWILKKPNARLRNRQLTYAGNQPVMISADVVAFPDPTTRIQTSLSVFGGLPRA